MPAGMVENVKSMARNRTSKAVTTKQDAIVTLDLEDSHGKRQLTFAAAQNFIHTCIKAMNFAQAASVSMQLADQLPQDPWPHLVAAESFYLHQQIEPAFRYIDRALDIDPQNIASLVVKSRLYLYSGKHADAKRLIESAVSLAPQNAQLQFEKGELLSEAGDLEGARKALLKSIELDARRAGSLLSLSRLPGDNFSDDLIRKVEFMIQSRQLAVEDQIKTHFALAHAYDKKAEFDKHFAHLNAGNNLKNRSLKFDPNESRQETQDTIDCFSEKFFKQRSRMRGNSAKIIFVVGFPRSGSTLIEHILSSHPSVSSAGEVLALHHAIRSFRQSTHRSARQTCWIDNQPDSALIEIADDYLHRVKKFHQNTYLTDKLLNNYLHVGLIHLIFPNAIIINVQRDPIAVCYSCYKNLFHLGSVPYTYNLTNLASKYRDYRRVIRHWNKVLPGKIYTVEYEQLVNKQAEVTRDLLEHCRLPWNDACLTYQKNTRTVLTSSSIQVRQPLYTDSIDRWKVYEKYLGPLLELTNELA
jgi:tetratricopeptide (TPR) repeat protein